MFSLIRQLKIDTHQNVDRKVLLVGWPTADWKIIHVLMDQGLMPHTKHLVQRGVMANLATLSPVLSPMLWTSIATGKRPFKHGICGFSEPTLDGTTVQPVTNLSRTTKAIWNILSQVGKRSLVVGWCQSHPAEPINGVMVSNRYQNAPPAIGDGHRPMADGTVHPPQLAEKLAKLRLHPRKLKEDEIRPFIPHAHRINQDEDQQLEMCLRTIANCTTIQSCATHLLETEPWDFSAVYFDSIDHFCRGFMKYHPPRQESVSEEDFKIYQNVVTAGYVYHDMMLGRLLELAGTKTTVILMSDHGFHPDHLRPKTRPVEPAGPAIEHRDFGILVIAGPDIKQDQLIHGASLLDITPTILSLFGLATGEDMDGRPLLEAFKSLPVIDMIPSWDDVPGDDGRHSKDRQPAPAETRETLDQLVALEYIERAAEDQERAVAQTKRELTYNLALSCIDGARHPRAAELLAELYRDYPLEFGFGVRLALCLQAMDLIDEMADVVDSLKARWPLAARKAQERLKGIASIARQRRKEWHEAQDSDDTEQADDKAVPPSKKTSRQDLFTDTERRVISNLRAIARGNERILDYLCSIVAVARRDEVTALDYLREAEQADSKTPDFYVWMGNTYIELNRNEDAERHFNRAVELDPVNPHAHVGLCRIHLKRRHNRKAMEAASTAVRLQFHFPQGHYCLGVARHRAGRLKSAIGSFERAISQNPNFSQAHWRLARIYRRLGQDEPVQKHRWMASQIHQVRLQQRQERNFPKLAAVQDVDFENQLPDFTERPREIHLKVPLEAVPI